MHKNNDYDSKAAEEFSANGKEGNNLLLIIQMKIVMTKNACRYYRLICSEQQDDRPVFIAHGGELVGRSVARIRKVIYSRCICKETDMQTTKDGKT
ncbi:MAG: hypothetical protein ACI9MS_001224 [Glaciecola sp.]|jgi:hypothetical protein